MVPVAILKAVEDAASVVQGSSDEGGEYFAMSLVESKLAAAVPDGSIIILPLTPPTDGQVIDFTYLAASKHMIHVLPQPLFTYGQCTAYSDGTGERPVPVGNSLKFPSATKYLVATVELVGLMRSSLGPEVSIPLYHPGKEAMRSPAECWGGAGGRVQGQTKRYVHIHLGSRGSETTNKE
jgi:hypothetical protein